MQNYNLIFGKNGGPISKKKREKYSASNPNVFLDMA